MSGCWQSHDHAAIQSSSIHNPTRSFYLSLSLRIQSTLLHDFIKRITILSSLFLFFFPLNYSLASVFHGISDQLKTVINQTLDIHSRTSAASRYIKANWNTHKLNIYISGADLPDQCCSLNI